MNEENKFNTEYNDGSVVELREKKESPGYMMWIIGILVVIVLIIIGYFVFGGSSANYFAIDNTNSENPLEDETTGKVKIDEVQLLTLESFPVQISAQVKGELSDKCKEAGTISQLRSGDTFYVNISEIAKENCEIGGDLEPVSYTSTIAIETIGLSKGIYTVDINGVKKEFTLDTDNAVDFQAGEQK